MTKNRTIWSSLVTFFTRRVSKPSCQTSELFVSGDFFKNYYVPLQFVIWRICHLVIQLFLQSSNKQILSNSSISLAGAQRSFLIICIGTTSFPCTCFFSLISHLGDAYFNFQTFQTYSVLIDFNWNNYFASYRLMFRGDIGDSLPP